MTSSFRQDRFIKHWAGTGVKLSTLLDQFEAIMLVISNVFESSSRLHGRYSVRIISGNLRGKVLSTIQGDGVRPTSDKIRGAIFSALLSRIGSFRGLHVLDMFAGSGALAIEALSRGASQAVLVDAAPSSQELLKKNLRSCKLEESTRLIRGDALKCLTQARATAPFDVVFIDPPYGKDLACKALEVLSANIGILRAGAWVVVEVGRSENLACTFGGLILEQQRDYGKTSIRYYHYHSEQESI